MTTQTRTHSHFSNKNKTIEHMFDVATRAHRVSIEFLVSPLEHFTAGMSKWETISCDARERNCIARLLSAQILSFLSTLTALNRKAANTQVKLGEMNSDCELLLPLCCAFTFVRSAQSVLVCPSTRTVDKSTAKVFTRQNKEIKFYSVRR